MRCGAGRAYRARAVRREEWRERSGRYRGPRAEAELARGFVLLDQSCDSAVEVGNLAGEEVDHRLDLRGDLVLARVVTRRFLGFPDIDQLSATSEEIGQSVSRGAARTRDGKVEDRAHLRKDPGIDAVGLGEDTGGPGELARLTWIGPREGEIPFGEGGDEWTVAAAGRLEDDEDIRVQ